MQTQRRRSRPLYASVVLGMVFTPSWAHAQTSGWRALLIDGSSPSSFESSVARLQNELPRARRQALEEALAAIWMRHSVVSADFDRDGDVDLEDARKLQEDTQNLLYQIHRGDVVSAVEEREGTAGGYTASDYFRELDGLGYDDVIGMAGPPSADHLAAVPRNRAQAACTEPLRVGQSPMSSRRCSDVGSVRVIGAVTGKALNEAIGALNAGQYAAARNTIEALPLDQLTPYERSAAEQILFNVSVAEGDYAQAREHLRNAVAAGGLDEQESAGALAQIRAIDTALSASPR